MGTGEALVRPNNVTSRMATGYQRMLEWTRFEIECYDRCAGDSAVWGEIATLLIQGKRDHSTRDVILERLRTWEGERQIQGTAN